MYKIWSRNRMKKKSIVANTMIELVTKGKRKLDITGPVTVVMEEDGTEVDDDEVLQELKGTRLIFLTEGQQWLPEGSTEDTNPVAVVPVPEPVRLPLPAACNLPAPTACLPNNNAPNVVLPTSRLVAEDPHVVLPTSRLVAEDMGSSVEFNDSGVHIQEQRTADNIDSNSPITLPQFSPTVLFHLESGTPEHVWEKMISEAGDFYMQANTPDLYVTYHYQLVGKTMYKRYPSIGQSGPHPWSRFTSNLSRRMRHIRWKRKKKADLCVMGVPKRQKHFTSDTPINDVVSYQDEQMLTYDENQSENDLRTQITKFETEDE